MNKYEITCVEKWLSLPPSFDVNHVVAKSDENKGQTSCGKHVGKGPETINWSPNELRKWTVLFQKGIDRQAGKKGMSLMNPIYNGQTSFPLRT